MTDAERDYFARNRTGGPIGFVKAPPGEWEALQGSDDAEPVAKPVAVEVAPKPQGTPEPVRSVEPPRAETELEIVTRKWAESSLRHKAALARLNQAVKNEKAAKSALDESFTELRRLVAAQTAQEN